MFVFNLKNSAEELRDFCCLACSADRVYHSLAESDSQTKDSAISRVLSSCCTVSKSEVGANRCAVKSCGKVVTLKPDFAALTYLMVNQTFSGYSIARDNRLSPAFHGSARLGVSRVHIYQREGEGSEVLCGRCGGTDDGACERDDTAFCCTSILGQQRVFSGYASEKY